MRVNRNAKPDVIERISLRVLFNEIRYEASRSRLSLDDRLNEAAQKHAEWMYRAGVLSHEGAPRYFWQRIRAEGYDYILAGENIAMGYASTEGVVNAWRRSAGHYRNIVDPAMRHCGFGRRGLYWCAIVAAPR